MYNQYNQRGRLSSPTVFGIDEKWERVLCYVFWWVSGLFFLLVEQKNRTVRRHAMQSIIVFGAISIVTFVLSVLSHIPLIGLVFGILGGIVGFVAFLVWIFLMIAAYSSSTTFVPSDQSSSRYV